MAKKGIVKFREERCKGCGLCTGVCPKGIIRVGDKINSMGYPVAEIQDGDKCTGCSFCAVMCPDVVISVFR